MTPPFVLLDPVAGRTSKRPISVYTALSELRFVSEEDEDTFSPLDPDSNPCQLSPVSQLQFASPEEAMTLVTESTEPSSHAPSPLFPTPYPSSTGVREEQARINPSEQLPSTACTRSPSLRRPGWPTPKPDGFVTSGPMRVRRRPLPEVPEHPQPRPLPPTPRPTEAVTVPHLPDSQGVSCSPRKEFIYDPLGDPLAPSRPASESERDARNQSVEGERPKPDPTPEDIPPALQSLTPAVTSLPTSSPPPNAFGSPPAPTIPIILPIVPKPIYPAPILPDLLSPTSIDLVTAAGLTITGENGQQLFFGALFRDRKVIVILIRHFWCLFCRNYVRSISNIVTPEILRKRGVDLVLIGNGAPGMIKAYKKSLKFPFPMYTDSSLQLHVALGLYKTNNQQPECSRQQAVGRSYAMHNGRWASLRVAVRVAAAKAVQNRSCSGSGDSEQLGGEFVFGPGLKSSFVHKMQNPRDHAPIVEVLEGAGVEVREKVIARPSDDRSLTLAIRAHGMVETYLTTTESMAESSLTSSSTTTTSTAGTTSTSGVPTSADRKVIDSRINSIFTMPRQPQCEPLTPIIENAGVWMARRSDSLARIKQKKEARRRGDTV